MPPVIRVRDAAAVRNRERMVGFNIVKLEKSGSFIEGSWPEVTLQNEKQSHSHRQPRPGLEIGEP